MNAIKSTEYPGWYEIPGYSGYCANEQGEILTKKTGNHTKGGNAGRYLKVSVYKDRSAKPSLQHVHDLICRAFHGPGQPGQVVLHDDDDRRNNTPGNLMWGSQSDNIKATYTNGLRQPTYGKRVSSEMYQEEEFSEFTHDGQRYSLNIVLQEMASYPVKQLPIKDLLWNVENSGDVDEQRVISADTSVPIMVVVDKRFNKPSGLVVIDGTHRLHKATRERKRTLPARVITYEQLLQFKIHHDILYTGLEDYNPPIYIDW